MNIVPPENYSPNSAPIGIFDSGVGGLTIWRELVALMPGESVSYFADEAHCPYGSRSPEEIVALSRRVTEFLLAKRCKLVVVACNTATTLAIDDLRQTFSIPFVGIEPGIKPAALATRSGVVGVLATAGTFRSKKFNLTKAQFGSQVRFIETEGEGLVEIVEAGRTDSHEAEALLRRYIEPMVAQGADQLVLGCTHYPFLEQAIRKITGDAVELVMPGTAVARRAHFLLSEHGKLNGTGGDANYEFCSSGGTEILMRVLNAMGVSALPQSVPLFMRKN